MHPCILLRLPENGASIRAGKKRVSPVLPISHLLQATATWNLEKYATTLNMQQLSINTWRAPLNGDRILRKPQHNTTTQHSNTTDRQRCLVSRKTKNSGRGPLTQNSVTERSRDASAQRPTRIVRAPRRGRNSAAHDLLSVSRSRACAPLHLHLHGE